jgi:hypothetical protein
VSRVRPSISAVGAMAALLVLCGCAGSVAHTVEGLRARGIEAREGKAVKVLRF